MLITQGNRKVGPYRAIFEFINGPLEGLHLHHECENPLCINPEHLKPVTRAEHNKIHGKLREKKTHCVNGHEYTEENTAIYRSGGRKLARSCRTCRRDAGRRYHATKRGE
jgi:hypothetical protein